MRVAIPPIKGCSMKNVLSLLFAAVLLLSPGLARSLCVVHGARDLIRFYANFPLIAEGKVLELASTPVRQYEFDSWPLRLTKFQITTYLKAPRHSNNDENRPEKLPSNVYWMLLQDRNLHVGNNLLIFATLETKATANISVNDFPVGRSRIWFADNGSCDSSVYPLQSVEAVALKRKVIQRLKKRHL